MTRRGDAMLTSRRRWLRGALLALLGLVTVLTPACSRRSANTASGGLRIVALSPAVAQILRDLGQGERLVGRHGFDTFSDQSIAVCGDQAGIDYEALLSVHPTHVVLQWGKRELPERLATLARTHGWVVKDYPLLSLADVDDAAADMARLFGAAAPAPIRQHEAGARPERAAVGRVLLLYAGDPPAALGPGSFHHELLTDLGATPAVTTGAAFITLDAEDVLRLAPDAILIFAPRAVGAAAAPDTVEEARRRLGTLGGLDLPALRGGAPRVALIDDPMSATPGTNLRGVRAALARVMDRWSAGGG